MTGIVKLGKKELNEVLYYLYKDNEKYGLIFELVYVYGRSINEVLKLRVNDVDEGSIEFELPTERFNFILYNGLKKPLKDYITGKGLTGTDYIFIDTVENINKYSKNLNYYLKSKIAELNQKVLTYKCPVLVLSDLKKLRGQHLFLDGADLGVINELYRNRNIQTTKSNIQYSELKLLRDKCNSLDKVFKEYTDLRVFHDNSFDETDIFMVVDEGSSDEVVFTFDYNEEVVNWVDRSNPCLVDVFKRKCVDCDTLRGLDVGDYLLFGDVRVIKN